MLNFAHGSVFMVGAFAGWGVLSLLARGNVLATSPALALFAMVAAGTAATALLGATIERLAYRPLRGGSRMAPLISALGVSIILENAAMLLTSGSAKTYQTDLNFQQNWAVHLAGANISATRIAMLASSVAIMIILDMVVSRTRRTGDAQRARTQRRLSISIRTAAVIAATFMVGSALAGVAGVMVGLYYTQIDFMIGFSAGLKAFTAAVLGGIGNFRGAAAGGLLLGLADIIGVLIAPPVYKDAIVFAVLIITLILRPSGLLGRQVRVRA